MRTYYLVSQRDFVNFHSDLYIYCPTLKLAVHIKHTGIKRSFVHLQQGGATVAANKSVGVDISLYNYETGPTT